jgi:hypothetical protein
MPVSVGERLGWLLGWLLGDQILEAFQARHRLADREHARRLLGGQTLHHAGCGHRRDQDHSGAAVGDDVATSSELRRTPMNV